MMIRAGLYLMNSTAALPDEKRAQLAYPSMLRWLLVSWNRASWLVATKTRSVIPIVSVVLFFLDVRGVA